MSLLFDASSLVNLIKKGITKPLLDGSTIDLAPYECLNAIWKEYALLKKLDRELALEFLDTIVDAFKIVDVKSIRGSEKEIFNFALQEKINVYDASYLYTAIKNNLTLITDDQELKSKASRHIKVISTEELASI